MGKTIIINRELSDVEVREVKQLAQSGSDVYAFPGNEIAGVSLRIEINPDEKRTVNFETMEEVLRFGDLRVEETTVSQLFSTDTASLWHYHKFRVYFDVTALMYFLRPVQRQFSAFDGHIWFMPKVAKPLQALFPNVDFRFPITHEKFSYNFTGIFKYLVLCSYRAFRQFFSLKTKSLYLVYLTENYTKLLHPETLQPIWGNSLLEYLILKLDKRFVLLTEVIMPKLKGKQRFRFLPGQARKTWGQCQKVFIESFMITGLLSREVRKLTREAKKTLDPLYEKTFSTDLSATQKLILEVFRSYHSSSGYYLFRYFAARKYLANSGLKAVVAYDENSPMTKTILDAAKFHGIKTIGLQHGTMHNLHPAYLYTPNDRENRVMPDLTLTWGTYWEDFLLEKGNYPVGSVVSVGQIRTDIIPVLTLLESNKPGTEPRILFASQPQRDPELRYWAAFDMFTAASNLPGTKLIVKLHPLEFGDTDYYADIAEKTGCKNYTIDKTSDLYQLIASCDVLITCFSTVGTETIYFHKPLVILDHLSQDIMGYAAEGVAFQATNAESLTTILSGIFKGTLRVDRTKYDTFIQKYAYKIDGKVAERCIKAIID